MSTDSGNDITMSLSTGTGNEIIMSIGTGNQGRAQTWVNVPFAPPNIALHLAPPNIALQLT